MGTTTMFLETATSLGSVTTSADTCLKEDGTINKKGVIASLASTTAVTATNCMQELSYHRVINNANAYMESMSDEELEQLMIALNKKEEALNSTELSASEENIQIETIQKVKTR